MWMKNILLAILGLSAGITAAGGLFSFIIGLGVVSDLRTGHIQVSMLCSMKMPLQWAAVSEQSSLSIIPRYHTEAGWFRWRDFSVESL